MDFLKVSLCSCSPTFALLDLSPFLSLFFIFTSSDWQSFGNLASVNSVADSRSFHFLLQLHSRLQPQRETFTLVGVVVVVVAVVKLATTPPTIKVEKKFLRKKRVRLFVLRCSRLGVRGKGCRKQYSAELDA